MTSPLVECVPNFSDGQRPEVIEKIKSTISGVPGTCVLDTHTDGDHNRSVVTFVGSPPAVEEAAFQMIKKAAELIDLDQHTGEHPRIGANSVITVSVQKKSSGSPKPYRLKMTSCRKKSASRLLFLIRRIFILGSCAMSLLPGGERVNTA